MRINSNSYENNVKTLQYYDLTGHRILQMRINLKINLTLFILLIIIPITELSIK